MYSASKRSVSKALKYSTHCQGISQFYLHILHFICKWNEPYLPLPSQPQLVLIYRPRRDGRLSRHWREVAQAEIQTYNLPIANLALYHTDTSAPVCVCLTCVCVSVSPVCVSVSPVCVCLTCMCICLTCMCLPHLYVCLPHLYVYLSHLYVCLSHLCVCVCLTCMCLPHLYVSASPVYVCLTCMCLPHLYVYLPHLYVCLSHLYVSVSPVCVSFCQATWDSLQLRVV